jgi:hypothetical protein
MSEVYSAERRGLPCQLPVAPRYVEFARKQATSKRSPEREKSEKFWVDQFKTVPPHLELPLDFPRPGYPTFAGGWEDRPLTANLCRELSRVSARQKSTLFLTFLAAYYVFLHRLTGQEEIVVGVPTAERSDEGSEKLVGHCINFLPLRSQLRGDPRFVDYLAELRGKFLNAFEHQNFTFGTLLQKLQFSRDRSRTPLVSAMFNMVWVRCGLNFPGLEVEIKPNPMSFSNFDLSFNITETDGLFVLDCSFKSDLLQGTTVKTWMQYFETLLEGIAADPEQVVSKLLVLPKAQPKKSQQQTVAAMPEATPNVAPRTPIEKTLARIWCEVIGLDNAGVHDNFFELGGHSVLVTQVAARIRKAFQVEVGLRTVFERPTIAELAEVIEKLLVEEISSMSEEEANRLARGAALVAKETA